MWRIFVEIGLHYLASVGILLSLYPWSISFGGSSFSSTVTLASYLIAAGIITALALGLLVIVDASLAKHSRPSRLLGGGILSVASLGVLTFGFGIGWWDLPGTRVHGIFFAEWQFLTFFFKACLPLCALGMGMEFLRLRHGRDDRPIARKAA